MDEDHSFISKDCGSTTHATRVTNLTANRGTKEPLITKATKFLAEDFKGFGDDINKHKKNVDDEQEEEFHSTMVKVDQACQMHSMSIATMTMNGRNLRRRI